MNLGQEGPDFTDDGYSAGYDKTAAMRAALTAAAIVTFEADTSQEPQP